MRSLGLHLEGRVAEAHDVGAVLHDLVVDGLVIDHALHVVGRGGTENGDVLAEYILEGLDAAVVGGIDSGTKEVHHGHVRVLLLQRLGHLRALDVGVPAVEVVTMGDGEFLALDRHEGDVLHGFAHAFASDNTATGGGHHASLRRQFSGCDHQILEIMAD